MTMKPYYSLKCYADGFPSLKYQFATLLKAQVWAHNLLADGYHTVEVLRYTCGAVDLVETIKA
jgi:hypothetical protein